MQKILMTWIEIHNPFTDLSINTIKKRCESPEDAFENFQDFHERLEAMADDYQGMVLDTNIGLIRLPSTLLSNSIINICKRCEQETPTIS